MLIESDSKYVGQLIELWHKVFGDEKDYIRLFFDTVYQKSKVFASFEDEKIVSVFYLLNCKIKFDSREYKGFYLYAAATDPDFRKRGLMGSLIEEAKRYCAENGVSFISLVPGNKPLYSYYSKFGFQTAMYKNVAEFDGSDSSDCAIKRADVASYFKIRSAYDGNIFIWEEDELSYVLDCFNYFDIHAYNGESFAFISDSKLRSVKELVCASDNLPSTVSKLSSFFGSEPFTIETPHDVGTRIPFGMICPIADALKREWSMNDIYMNLALD